MGRALAQADPAAARVFDRGREIMGEALLRTMWEGPEEELVRTDRTQPALFLHSAAVLATLSAQGIGWTGAAGHSVGEFGALYAAGSLDFETALELVRVRSAAMQEAALKSPGGMLAVLGIDMAQAEEACRRASAKGICVPANDNCPGQIVLSGEKASLEAAEAAAKELGARKCIPLAVAGAWHSPLMERAAERLAEAAANVEIRPPRFPVYSNVTAAPYANAEEIRALIVRQVVSPVRWREILEILVRDAEGRVFVEVGTGNVLSGLLRRVSTNKKVRAHPCGTPEEIETTRKELCS